MARKFRLEKALKKDVSILNSNEYQINSRINTKQVDKELKRFNPQRKNSESNVSGQASEEISYADSSKNFI